MGEKRFQFRLHYYEQQLQDGTQTNSSVVIVAADTVEEAQTIAQEQLGESIEGRRCFCASMVEFAAHLRQ
jgi:hypothetical protein